MGLAELERKKYEKVWKRDEYKLISPGVAVFPLFRQMVRWNRPVNVVDIGCGDGSAMLKLAELHNVSSVTGIDHVNVLKDEAQRFEFYKHSLWVPWSKSWYFIFDIGYCCDVMEHIPPEKVDTVLTRIASKTLRTFFSISFVDDRLGELVGEKLHLTVQPFEWWVAKLSEFGEVRNARDLLGMGVFDVKF